MDNTFLFFGDSQEYVLHPLYRKMKEMGYDCVEIDLQKTDDCMGTVRSLQGQPVVLLTSAHLFKDEPYCRQVMQVSHPVVSALEVMELLRPVRSVYYPHDLNDGMQHYDRYWFSLFDLFLSPLPTNAHARRFCREYAEVGWIKKDRTILPGHKEGPVVVGHAFSGMTYYWKMGLDKMYDFYAPIWEQGAKVKMYDSAYAPMFNDFLDQKSVARYDHTCNIYDLIEESSVVVTTGPTSVSVEAALAGRMVLNVLDGSCPEAEQRSLAAGLPNTRVCSVEEAASAIRRMKAGKEPVFCGKEIMKPFDYEKAVQYIVGKQE